MGSSGKRKVLELWLRLSFRRAISKFLMLRFLLLKRSRALVRALALGAKPVALFDVHKLPGRLLTRIPASRRRKITLTRQVQRKPKTVSLSAPELHVIEASNVVFEPLSEVIGHAGALYRQRPFRYYPGYRGKENLSNASPLLAWNSRRFGLAAPLELGVPARIESGILLNGQSSTNWYHWVVNILPRAFIADQLVGIPPEVPLLISESVRGENLEKMLRLVIDERRVIRFIADRLHLASNAIVVESPAKELYSPTNTFSNPPWKRLGDFHIPTMAAFRTHLLARAQARPKITDSDLPRRIFLVRSNETRPYNQDEVELALAPLGFSPVQLELLSPDQQILLMANAELVVGPTGAQWASWLFSSSAKGLILIPKFLRRSSLFSKLGHFGNSTLYEFFMDSEHLSWPHYFGSTSATVIDVRRLVKAVQHMLDSPD